MLIAFSAEKGKQKKKKKKDLLSMILNWILTLIFFFQSFKIASGKFLCYLQVYQEENKLWARYPVYFASDSFLIKHKGKVNTIEKFEIYTFKKKSKFGHIRIINLFPSC